MTAVWTFPGSKDYMIWQFYSVTGIQLVFWQQEVSYWSEVKFCLVTKE
jgi:hypothetical protein